MKEYDVMHQIMTDGDAYTGKQKTESYIFSHTYTLSNSRESQGRVPPRDPSSFFFIQLLAENLQNNRLPHHF